MLNVYMTGVIYFNGCNETAKCVYAPNGTDSTPKLDASLWIAAADVQGDAWAEKIQHNLGGVNVIEFKIPSPATLTFPASGEVNCEGLDGGLSKLKKKQGSSEVDLQVSTNPETIAEVPIDGGVIRPRLYKGIRLVGWEIDSSSTQITAHLKSGGSRSITVRDGAEVVFTNIPAGPDFNASGHVQLFDKLTVQTGLLIANPPVGPANPIPGNDAILEHIRFAVTGNTPGCCRS